MASFDLSDAAAHGSSVEPGCHLRADAVFTSEVAKIASFADGARQRLLNVACLPAFNASAVMQVCVWSGVLTTTASILSIISRRVRDSPCRASDSFRRSSSLDLRACCGRYRTTRRLCRKDRLVGCRWSLAAGADTGDRETFKRGSASDLSSGTSDAKETGASDSRLLDEITSGSLETHYLLLNCNLREIYRRCALRILNDLERVRTTKRR